MSFDYLKKNLLDTESEVCVPQLSKILEFRNDKAVQQSYKASQSSLRVLERISVEGREENTLLLRLAQQSQKDSRTLTALTVVATFYLPASLIAVRQTSKEHLQIALLIRDL